MSDNTDQNSGPPSADEKNNPVKLEDLRSGIQRPEKGGRVCITYGRDQIMNKQVVSLIREFGIDPIVMQDKTNKAKPVAQFYTEHPDISFAIAILSADDWVYPKAGKPKDALLYADQRVVFHVGFWVGRLGRNHVFALYYDQKSFRWPTEHFDVIYTPLDKNGIWKKELGRRLKESGITIIEK
jgi:predicted nucleotide-binding protein